MQMQLQLGIQEEVRRDLARYIDMILLGGALISNNLAQFKFQCFV